MKTTAKDFREFKKAFRKWQKYFSLLNWEIRFTHEGSSKNEGLASTVIYLENYMAIVNLCEEMHDHDYKNKTIESLAFHEVCELMLGRLRYIANSRFITSDAVIEADHEIVRILENTLFKDAKP